MALTKAHNRMIEGSMANVKDYGAIGDGTTDDTAAFNAAIAANNTILVPNGSYVISSPLDDEASPRTNLIGESRESTTLKYTGSSNGMIRGLINLQNMTLNGAGSTSAYGLHVTNVATPTNFTGELFYDNLEIREFNYGVVIDNAYLVKFTNCKINYNNYGVHGTTPSQQYRTQISFEDTLIRFNTIRGVFLEGGTITTPNISFVNSTIEGNGNGTYTYQAYFSKIAPLTFRNSYLEMPNGVTTHYACKIVDCATSVISSYVNATKGFDLTGSTAKNRFSAENTYFTQTATVIDVDSNCIVSLVNGCVMDGVTETELTGADYYCVINSRINSNEYNNSADYMTITDGRVPPSTISNRAHIFVNNANGDLSVRFGDGTIKVIVTDT